MLHFIAVHFTYRMYISLCVTQCLSINLILAFGHSLRKNVVHQKRPCVAPVEMKLMTLHRIITRNIWHFIYIFINFDFNTLSVIIFSIWEEFRYRYYIAKTMTLENVKEYYNILQRTYFNYNLKRDHLLSWYRKNWNF
jgi:hypothetical protein